MEKRTAKLSAQVLEEASTWFIDFNENKVDRAGCEEFNVWLRRSPECVRAFLQISVFWEDAGTFSKWSKLDTDGLIARALAEQNVLHLELTSRGRTDSSVVALQGELRDADQADVTISSRAQGRSGSSEDKFATPKSEAVGVTSASNRRWLAAAAMLLVLGTGIATWYDAYITPTYITGIGEQRSITLEDGSLVELNARSRLRVHFTEEQRSVDLLEGQALFTVAKNPARPFVVTTNNTRVRAVGTQFDVYRKHSGTVVTVVEGRVAVNPTQRATRGSSAPLSRFEQRVQNSQPADGEMGARAKREILLAAGEQMTITPIKIAPPAPVNTAIATAWTRKRLVFESTPLREVVEEFNRYNRQQLIIRDPELFDFHVSGVFPSTDSSRMIEFLRQRFGVTMNSSGEEIEISRREKAGPVVEQTKNF